MVIGIDARATVASAAGRGRVVTELIESLAPSSIDHTDTHFILYTTEKHKYADLGPHIKWRHIKNKSLLWHVNTAKDVNNNCDIYLSSNSYLTPLFVKVPVVLMVYDLIPYISSARPRLRSRIIEKVALGRAIKKANRVITISESTKQDLTRYFPQVADKTDVVHLGVRQFSNINDSSAAKKLLADHGVLGDYILFTGTIEPRKNISALVDAFAQLSPELRDKYPLVIVGKKGWKYKEILSTIENMEGSVFYVGSVTDQELTSLYRSCTLFCYPSLYEGFGLPVIEAMSQGAPVITSSNSSLPEVGGNAAEYVDPHSIDSIRSCLERVLTNEELRTEMSQKSTKNAARFSWEDCANSILNIMREATK